jgi:hypothetical protein
MKYHRLSTLTLLAFSSLGLFLAVPAKAAHDHGSMSAESTSGADQTDWLAKAKAEYPLTTCVVSGDELKEGSMGGPVDYIHKEAGKPDRLVRFCCKDCVKDFKKNPAKYLKKIDDAAAAKGGHADHAHHM